MDKYWWCRKCKKNVDILIAHGIGIFCIECGKKVYRPKNRKKISKFYVDDTIVDKTMNKW